MPIPKVTPAQLRFLRSIARLIEATGIAPTVRELVKDCGFASTNAASDFLLRLQAKGLVVWERLLSRTIRITDLGWDVLAEFEQPLPVGQEGYWLIQRDPPVAFIPIIRCPTCEVSRVGRCRYCRPASEVCSA